MRIAQIAPLTESVPPRLYGGTERVVSFPTEQLVDMATASDRLQCRRDLEIRTAGGSGASRSCYSSWRRIRNALLRRHLSRRSLH